MAQNYTYPSLPAVAVGLKDAENVSAEFTYNFFMADERINESSAILPIDNATDHAYFVSRSGKLPRYITLNFSQKSARKSKNIGLTNIVAGGAQIIYEDAPFNTNLSAIVVVDTIADTRSYLIVSSSNAIFSGSLGAPAPVITQDKTSKSFIFDSLHNIQSEGYQYAQTDSSQLVRDQFLENVRGFSSGLSLNNLFISDISNRILENQNSIFADEFAAALERSNYIQGVSRGNTTPYRIPSSAYDMSIPYYSYEQIPTKKERFFDKPDFSSEVCHVGFVIEKFGQNVDGSVKVYDSIYVDNPRTTSLIDANVRYGAVYSYTVRSIYETIVYVATETVAGRPTGIAKAKMLIATTGKNVDRFCEETVPPPPPEDVFFNLMAEGNLFIGWQFPFNKQRDIKKFQVFRRKSINEPFELLQVLDFDDSVVKTPNSENIPNERISYKTEPTCFYVDQGFNLNSKYIYAIVSVDAHGYTSNYSTQFEVSVNMFTESLIIKDVIRKGCPKPYPNLLLNQDFFVDLLKDSGHTQMKVFFNPDYTDLVDSSGNKLGVIKYNNNQPTYKLHILETNLAQDQIIDITLRNEKIPITIPISEAKVYTQVR